MNRSTIEQSKYLEVICVVLMLLVSDGVRSALNPAIAQTINISSYIFVALLIIISALNGKLRTSLLYAITRDPVLLLLIALALLSFCWSGSPSDTWNFGRTLLRSLVFGAYLAARFSLRGQMYLMGATLFFTTIASFFASVIPPYVGIRTIESETVWLGIYAHKQFLARAMAVAVITFISIAVTAKSGRYRVLWGISALLAFYILLMSGGRSALVTLVFCLCLFPFYYLLKLDHRVRLAVLLITLFVTAVSIFFIWINLDTILTDVLGKDAQFNGRTPLWASVIERGLERPWFGYGYRGFWNTPEAFSAVNDAWTFDALQKGAIHAHSIFVEIFLQLGFVGLFIFLLSYGSVTLRLLYLLFQSPKIENFWMLQTVVASFILQSTEVPITLSPNIFLWLFYISFCFSSVLEIERFKRWQQKVAASRVWQPPSLIGRKSVS
ncbi:MAG: O-antigen ligase family protein [Leptolyngbya sp. UWPOB_LEPTO1]|uniref:O-antigen ligase family protein n=1 Tax=Leptolyngbya sp. UWPOB_LEPTO1 TaxID=2815653 RepID=UPI001AD02069|nr:O-antigen ligase family protein [Leptolyngbya sp. UWPOB_LEPTO1]MBN8560367.1 O-antigen ligase family protein [Leptolyngbya sp. UWPOB_LEPTO1]